MSDLEKMKSGTYRYEPNVSSFPQGNVGDDLIKRLQDGVVEHDKRWSGDTHEDLGGSANYEATEAIMSEAATALAEAHATIARLEAELAANGMSLEAAEGQADRMRIALELCQRLGSPTVQRIARAALSPVALDQGEG